MRYLLHLLVFFSLAAAVGLGLTGLAVNRNLMFGEVREGAWVAYPSVGSIQADPYARASVARRGRIPLALGDGLEFVAALDDGGAPLRRDCVYAVKGAGLPARYWTIAAQATSGVDNSTGRSAFTSAELLREEGGAYLITVSARARPGNWLASDGAGPFRLVLRLYDTPLATRGAQASALPFPTVTKVSCR
jgi:hypothetical protein